MTIAETDEVNGRGGGVRGGFNVAPPASARSASSCCLCAATISWCVNCGAVLRRSLTSTALRCSASMPAPVDRTPYSVPSPAPVPCTRPCLARRTEREVQRPHSPTTE